MDPKPFPVGARIGQCVRHLVLRIQNKHDCERGPNFHHFPLVDFQNTLSIVLKKEESESVGQSHVARRGETL